MTSLALAALTVVGGDAWALGLGRLDVQSALGEPLRAEIDISSITPEEAASLSLKIASSEAYRAAGVEYNAVMQGTQATLARRPDGRPYIRLASDRVLNEPFVDLILELSWASGKLVREYTLLVDPPRVAATPPAAPPAPVPAAMAPATAPAAAPATAAQAAQAVPAPAAAPAPPAASRPASPPARAPAPAPAVAPPAAPVAKAAAPAEVKVQPGDTLSVIASRVQPGGVSLDQMLVSLFRANPQAFAGENMNRLKAGSVLAVPPADEIRGVTPADARSVIQAQSADFNAYRQRLASGVPTTGAEPASRQAAGKVQASVDDRKEAAAPTPDRLKLSQGGVKPTAPEAKISKDKESQDAAARVAELSRNVAELKQLQGSTTAATVPPAASAPAQKVAPAVAAAPPAVPAVPAPASAAKPAPAPAPAPATAAAPAPAIAPAPAPAVATASAPATAAPTLTAAAPKPESSGDAAADEPGLLDSLLDNELLLPGAGVLLALLAGVGVYRMRSRSRKPAGETSFLESRLQPDSFFGQSGGQRVDTREATPSSQQSSSSMSYSLSQLDAIGDVDPVAEADVYLAYGRDLQAEEILKEALRSTPERLAIRSKLLEVYAKRRDTKGFELLATQLFALTSGAGEEWFKAQELGLTIDPENPLYQPGAAPESVVHDGNRVVEPLGASTLPYSASTLPPESAAANDRGPEHVPADQAVDLDLDLDLDQPASPSTIRPAYASTVDATRPMSATTTMTMAMPPTANAFEAQQTTSAMPFAITSPPAAADNRGIDLDLSDVSFDLGAEPSSPGALRDRGPDTRPSAAMPLHAGAEIDFDLPDVPSELPDESADPLARKVDLAEEFRQIGDIEGARDLLEEVVAQADGALKTKAQTMLTSLG